jgi:hypothetical protein
MSVNGKVTLDPELEQAGLRVIAPSDGPSTESRRETRVNGAVRGGGPTITLRAQRGDIGVRSK